MKLNAEIIGRITLVSDIFAFEIWSGCICCRYPRVRVQCSGRLDSGLAVRHAGVMGVEQSCVFILSFKVYY